MWASAFRYCFGNHNLKIDPRDHGAAVEWSPGHIPDITAFNKAEGGFHICADTKGANVFASQYDGTPASVAERASVGGPLGGIMMILFVLFVVDLSTCRPVDLPRPSLWLTG